MGVPLLYRWLSERYPLINRSATSLPHAEIDNLYVDANGILHNCTHGASKPPDKPDGTPPTEADMMIAICSYLDSLVQMVRPARLLYIAIDGVAPRAKMNQQRQRRFRVERERERAAEIAAADADAKRQKVEAAGLQEQLAPSTSSNGNESAVAPAEKDQPAAETVPAPETPSPASTAADAEPQAAATTTFDSNCITPGTEFMSRCAEVLAYYIRHKLQTDEVWRSLRVILSAADAPGEGEHKIAEHIRSARELPRRHCVYGLDADLIMLALATHAPTICILREKVVFRKASADDRRKVSLAATGDFIVLYSTLLRRYLDLEFSALALPFAYSLERVIDDLVLISFLVGNDFLPHPPGLQIENNGLDRLFGAYKKLLPLLNGYLVERRQPVATRLGRLLAEVATAELNFLVENPDAARSASEGARDEAPDGTLLDAPSAEVEVDDGGAREEMRAKEQAEENAIMALAAAAAVEGGGSCTVPRSALSSGSTIEVHPEVGPAVAPWKAPGGFSFAKVLKGERLASRLSGDKPKSGANAADAGETAAFGVSAASGTLDGASSMLKGMLGLAPAATTPDNREVQTALTATVPGRVVGENNEARLAAAAAELDRQRASALTSAALEGLAEEERDVALGERIYAVIQHLDDTQAGKMTGMLLEREDAELIELLAPPDVGLGAQAFLDKVEEAREVLAAYDAAQAIAAKINATHGEHGSSPPPSPPSSPPPSTWHHPAISGPNASAMPPSPPPSPPRDSTSPWGAPTTVGDQEAFPSLPGARGGGGGRGRGRGRSAGGRGGGCGAMPVPSSAPPSKVASSAAKGAGKGPARSGINFPVPPQHIASPPLHMDPGVLGHGMAVPIPPPVDAASEALRRLLNVSAPPATGGVVAPKQQGIHAGFSTGFEISSTRGASNMIIDAHGQPEPQSRAVIHPPLPPPPPSSMLTMPPPLMYAPPLNMYTEPPAPEAVQMPVRPSLPTMPHTRVSSVKASSDPSVHSTPAAVPVPAPATAPASEAAAAAAEFAAAALNKKEGLSAEEDAERVAALMELHMRALPPTEAAAHRAYYASRIPLQGESLNGSPPTAFEGKVLAAFVARWCEELLRGLRWSLTYYLDGVPSWSWFFPYHHSPLLVDVAALLYVAPNMPALKEAWPSSRPLRPFEQLLTVLPRSSAPLLPSPHAALLTTLCDPKSNHPLHKFYPREYYIEKDAKGRAWRDVALLPFLDVPALLKEVAALPPAPEADIPRNAHGLAHAFAYDAMQRADVRAPSALNGRMPALRRAQSVTLRITGAPPRGHARVSDDASIVPALLPRGWPELSMRVPFSMTLREEHVVLEAMSSIARGKSWIIELPGAHQLGMGLGLTRAVEGVSADVAAIARRLLLGEARGRVFVDWPYCNAAKAVSVASVGGRWWLDRRGESVQHCDIHPGEWRRLKEELSHNTLSHRAIDVGGIAIVVYVLPLAGYTLSVKDNSLVERWANSPLPVPAQLVLPEWGRAQAPPLRTSRRMGLRRLVPSRQVIVIDGEHYGLVGTVVSAPVTPTAQAAAAAEAVTAAKKASLAQAIAHAEAAAAAGRALSVESAAQSSSWECLHCTLVNDGSAPVCAACETPRESEGSQTPPSDNSQMSSTSKQNNSQFEVIDRANNARELAQAATAAAIAASRVSVCLRRRPPLPALPMVIPERGQSERELAQRLNVHTSVVARLSGSVSVIDASGKQIEIGLGIKSRRKRLVAVGWCRLRPAVGGMDEVWEYLGIAEKTLREYQQEYPSVFSMLQARPRGENYSIDEAFPQADDSYGWGPTASSLNSQVRADAELSNPLSASSRLLSLVAWLDATGSRVAQLVPADMLRLSRESVARAEAELSALSTKEPQEMAGSSDRNAVTVELPAASLLTPTESLVNLGGFTANHLPGEYVTYIRGAGPVPFGERGIVLATQGARCEVIFEHEGFCSFGHFSRLNTSRAAVVPATSLLNLSRPPRAAAEAAADARKHARAAALGHAFPSDGAAGSDFVAFARGTNPYSVLDTAPAE